MDWSISHRYMLSISKLAHLSWKQRALPIPSSFLERTLLTRDTRQIPLSWRDAQKLLRALRGHGIKLDDHWKGAVPKVDEWWTGDANSPIVLLQNDQEEVERNPIYNVLGKITGVEQSEKSSTYCLEFI